MGLFYRRNLCFFCFVFIVTSILVAQMGLVGKQWIILTTAFICAFCFFACIAVKRKRILFLSMALLLCAVIAATANSAMRISYKQLRAEKYIGDRSVTMHVLSENYVSDHTSSYAVRINEINGDKVTFKALLVCAFPTDLEVGDTVVAGVELFDANAYVLGMSAEQRSDDSDILLTAALYSTDGAKVDRFDRELPLYRYFFEENGITVLVSDIKNSLTEKIESLFGRDTGGIVKGFLLGDKSDIPTNVIRDFRRSGVSHLFAVSGLHISVLLGMIELILRKLYAHKYVRIGIVSFFALVLLALTGFSMSALRAVLMLWLVYVTFLCSEESDSITILFCSITLIILVFPYSVWELGMWMSFLATLGLVSVYPVFESMIPKVKKEMGAIGIPITVARYALLILLMTVVCNIFLLPIQWKIFGEISLVSVVANILLSSLTALFMVSSIIALFLGALPIIGEAVTWTVQGVCGLICGITEYLSGLELATVSLRYVFTDALVIMFTAIFTVMLVIRLKRKWLIALPAISFAVVFTVCVAIFNIRGEQKVTYYGDGTREMLSVRSADTLCLVDMSNGSYYRFADALRDAAEGGATSIQKIVFTDITENHMSSMEYLFRSAIVKSIYIPTPADEKSLNIAISMALLAEKCGVETYLYDTADIIGVSEMQVCVNMAKNGDKKAVAVFVNGEDRSFGYVDAFIDGSDAEKSVNVFLGECDTVIIGNNGVPDGPYSYSLPQQATLIYSSEDISKMSQINGTDLRTYCNFENRIELTFKLK